MICNHCQREFDTPATAYQMHDEVDTMQEDSYPICPYCESDDIEETEPCPICDNTKRRSFDYCIDCIRAIGEDVTSFINDLQERYGIDYKTAVEWLHNEIERRV